MLLISGEDRDEPLLPMVGEEIEIEAEESQDQEVRDDYEHEADVDPIHDPLANVTKIEIFIGITPLVDFQDV